MILNEIVQNTRIELEARKKKVLEADLKLKAQSRPRPLSLAAALTGTNIKLIAEVKKASPSKGVIRAEFDPVDIARTYASHGASAISILTDKRYFQGNLDYLEQINASLGETRPPLLRKDFIFDPYQIYESRAYGADALLLITAILTPEKLSALLKLAHSLQMQCLVETHTEDEIKTAVASGAEIIGINNRDLTTFKVDLETTARLRRFIPEGRIVISESGIKNYSDMQRLQSLKVNAALVGETLMASPDIGKAMKELL